MLQQELSTAGVEISLDFRIIIIIIIIILYFNSWQSATDIQQTATQDSTDTIEHKKPIIIQLNITKKYTV